MITTVVLEARKGDLRATTLAYLERECPKAYQLLTTFDLSNAMDPAQCREELAWLADRVHQYLIDCNLSKEGQ
jgi:hypothetical protein